MGRQIIKQPNGKYCIFSSIVDSITHYDMSVESIIEEWVRESEEEITKNVNNIVDKLESSGKPYYQFTKSYESMISTIKEINGEKESNAIKSLIEANDDDIIDNLIY